MFRYILILRVNEVNFTCKSYAIQINDNNARNYDTQDIYIILTYHIILPKKL